MRCRSALVLLALLAAAALAQDDADTREAPRPLSAEEHRLGERIPDLALVDLDGREGRLSDYADARVVILAMAAVDCPLSRRYAPRLAELEREWRERGVALLLVDPMPGDLRGELHDAARAWRFDGRVVPDPEQEIARALDARTTTDVFVLDGTRTLLWRGAVDDQYGIGYALPQARRAYLREVVADLLSERVVRTPPTTAPGCRLALRRVPDDAQVGEPPTWHGRISRLVAQHCRECHRAGEAAPFALDGYDDARANAAMMAHVVRRGRMPPAFAGPDGLPLRNDRRLSPRDRDALVAWVRADCPEGDPVDAPRPRAWPEGWRIGEPDAVYALPGEIEVPAQGAIEYRYVQVPTGLAEDRWVQAMEVRPTAPEVVHHVLVFVRFPKGDPRRERRPADRNGLGGYFAGLVPGQGAIVYPPGYAKKLPAGAELLFQIHYTANGAPARDRTRLGLVFAPGPPRREVRTTGISDTGFRIPPGAADHRVEASIRLPFDVELLGFLPHMHVRGKAFRYRLEQDGAQATTLLDIPRYDFDWQLYYELREPVRAPSGAVLRAIAWYDNSADNPANPDPDATVRHGEQTWEEMMIGYVDWVRPEGDG